MNNGKMLLSINRWFELVILLSSLLKNTTSSPLCKSLPLSVG